VRGAAVDHPENRSDDPTHRGHVHAVAIARAGDGVVVPEQFVRAVDEIDLQRQTSV